MQDQHLVGQCCAVSGRSSPGRREDRERDDGERQDAGRDISEVRHEEDTHTHTQQTNRREGGKRRNEHPSYLHQLGVPMAQKSDHKSCLTKERN